MKGRLFDPRVLPQPFILPNISEWATVVTRGGGGGGPKCRNSPVQVVGRPAYPKITKVKVREMRDMATREVCSLLTPITLP